MRATWYVHVSHPNSISLISKVNGMTANHQQVTQWQRGPLIKLWRPPGTVSVCSCSNRWQAHILSLCVMFRNVDTPVYSSSLWSLCRNMETYVLRHATPYPCVGNSRPMFWRFLLLSSSGSLFLEALSLNTKTLGSFKTSYCISKNTASHPGRLKFSIYWRQFETE